MMSHLSKKSIVSVLMSIFVVFLLFFAVSVHAQFASNPYEIPVTLSVSPDHPGPFQQVNLSVTSYLADLDNAQITWYVNGKRISSDKGQRTFSTTLGESGTVTTVKTTIETQNQTITKSITFKPLQVALVWESTAYTPLFYQGKAQVGPHSQVRIIALPQFSKNAFQNTYTFTWSRDGRILGSQSGYGRNTLEITSPLVGVPTTIGVKVSSSDGTQADASIVIKSIAPKLIVYPYSPAYGTLYNRAITNTFTFSGSEMSFSAVPYFISTSGSQPSLSYTWTMNGNKVDTQGNVMTFRNESSTTGSTQISVSAQTDAYNQTDQRIFLVNY